MANECPLADTNERRCNCTYPGCPRHGRCCECLHYHLARKELAACCFDTAAEATWDRSFRKFIEANGGRG
ncbi:MAG: cytosolic protein [Deltaproteobacteria bacterium]|nr:cytosolic protein [Deltaproteobacteria bacterium]